MRDHKYVTGVILEARDNYIANRKKVSTNIKLAALMISVVLILAAVSIPVAAMVKGLMSPNEDHPANIETSDHSTTYPENTSPYTEPSSTAPDTPTAPDTSAPGTTDQDTYPVTETTDPVTVPQTNTEKPSTDPSTDPVAPVTNKPDTDQSVTDKPVTDKPVTDKPVTDKPVTDKPVTDKPVTDKPITTTVGESTAPVTTKEPGNDPVIPSDEELAKLYDFYYDVDGNYYIKVKTSVKNSDGDKNAEIRLPENIVIPTSYKSIPITGIGDHAFRETSIKSVIIPEGITVIGDYAFYDCKKLTDVSVPSTVTKIGSSAFLNCGQLKYETYEQCRYLGNSENKYVALVRWWPLNHEQLITLSIHSGTKVISDYAFRGVETLEKIEFPSSITAIGVYTFGECTGLKSLELPKNLKTIYQNAFTNCTSIRSVGIPEGVTYIYPEAFSGCTALESISLPDSILYFPANAVSSCTALEYNYYADGKYLGNKSSPYLVFIDVAGSDSKLTKFHESTKVISEGEKLQMGIEKLVLPDSVIWIGGNSFYGQESLTSVTIGKNVEYVGAAAFSTCSSVESVTIEGGKLTHIYGGTFANMKKLTSIVIPEGITQIGSGAFRNCENLTTVTLPSTLKTLSFGVFCSFENCMRVRYVYYAGTKAEWSKLTTSDSWWCPSDMMIVHCKDGEIGEAPDEYFDKYFIFELLPDGTCSIKARVISDLPSDLVIPSQYNGRKVSAIAESGFEKAVINTLTVPGSINAISKLAFRYSTVKKVVLSEGVTEIGASAFSFCQKLEEVRLPESLIAIRISAFGGCSNLERISIPSGVRIIESGSFYNSEKLIYNRYDNALYLGNDSDPYKALISVENKDLGVKHIKVHETTTVICNGAFSGCSDLESVELPENLIYIGDSAFGSCSALKSVNIPGSIGTIRSNTFSSCTSLETVYIGEGVTSINQYAFSSCPSLKTIYIPKSVKEISKLIFTSKADIVIEYAGTVEEWNSISDGQIWDNIYASFEFASSGHLTVICSDGEAKKD